MKGILYNPVTGEETIVDDPSFVEPPQPVAEPTTEDRIKALEDAILALM